MKQWSSWSTHLLIAIVLLLPFNKFSMRNSDALLDNLEILEPSRSTRTVSGCWVFCWLETHILSLLEPKHSLTSFSVFLSKSLLAVAAKQPPGTKGWYPLDGTRRGKAVKTSADVPNGCTRKGAMTGAVLMRKPLSIKFIILQAKGTIFPPHKTEVGSLKKKGLVF